MEFELSELQEAEARDFLDYLRAELKEFGWPRSGSAEVNEEGEYHLELEVEQSVDEMEVTVTWHIETSDDGAVRKVSVDGPTEAVQVDWRTEAESVYERAYNATVAGETECFFKRNLFSYFGPPLDGEYWLGSFRLAPVDREEGEAIGPMYERAVAIDQTVDAIDESHAGTLARARSQRLIARVSLILNVPIERPLPGCVWVRVDEDALKENEPEYRRANRAFPSHVFQVEDMPDKGELCPPGEYRGTISEPFRPIYPHLTLPKEAPELFASIESSSVSVRDRLDRCARLYQLGLLLGRRYPSAGLAYTVAALDALAPNGKSHRKAIREFLEEHVQIVDKSVDVDDLLKFAYWDVRSAHFHGGSFPIPEDTGWTQRLPDPDNLKAGEQASRIHTMVRAAILSWLTKEFLIEERGDCD